MEPIYTCQRKPTSERLKFTIIVHDDRCFTNDSRRHRFQSTVKLNVEYQRIMWRHIYTVCYNKLQRINLKACQPAVYPELKLEHSIYTTLGNIAAEV